jgi:hypothetical protein
MHSLVGRVLLMTLRSTSKALLVLAGLQVAASSAACAQHLHGVLELFTSQGCSSCPPADALAAKFAHDPELLVLSFPVDYWDYIGWKDTLASPANSARQTNYCRARSDSGVYTPQVVVDGLAAAVGSEAGEIESAVATAARRSGSLSVDLKLSESADKLHVDIGAAAGDAPRTAGVWLARIARAVTVAIGRGENAGHTVTYTNVVRQLTKIGEWTGKETAIEIPLANAHENDNDAYAVLLQAGTSSRPGAILGAAKSEGL